MIGWTAANDNNDFLNLRLVLRFQLLAHGIDPVRDRFAVRMETWTAFATDCVLQQQAREVRKGRALRPDFFVSRKLFFSSSLSHWVAEEAARRRQPPKTARALLLAASTEARRDSILGDLAEVYGRNVAALGVRAARRAYRGDVLRSLPPLTVQAVRRQLAAVAGMADSLMRLLK